MNLTRVRCLRSGESLSLTEELGSGGEGTVFKTSKPNYVAKIYSSKANQEKCEKLRVMLDNPPSNPSLSKEHISIAWPVDILLDQYQNYVGFLMPEIRNSKPLISVYSSAKRKKEAVGFNWLYLHTAAFNTALILESLHRSHYTVGDLKSDNLRVNDRALVSIVDTDSFQVKDVSTGTIYYSSMGSDEYTPPEMYGKDLSSVERSEVQDLFGLAIVIWLLIFGKHPFSGKSQDSSINPQINDNIRAGYWVDGDQSKIKLPDLAIPIRVVYPELQQLFYRCFTVGHDNPYARPTASEWCRTLKIAVNDLQRCPTNTEHYYSTAYNRCHWCEINARLKYDHFPANPLAGSNESPTRVSIPVPAASIPTTLVSPRTSTIPKTKMVQSSKSSTIKPPKNQSSSPLSTSSTSSSTNQAGYQYQVAAPIKSKKKRSKGLGILAFVFTSFFLLKPSYDLFLNVFSNSQAKNNDSNLGKYPLDSCGDFDSPSVDTWYPIFIKNDSGNLNKIKSRFCRDAFPKQREKLNRVDIQVASFRNPEKAEEFAELMRSQFGSGEIGQPSRH